MDREKIFSAAQAQNLTSLADLLNKEHPSPTLSLVLTESLLIACGSRELYNSHATPAGRKRKTLDEVIELLLIKGADVNSKGFEGRTALHHTAHLFPHNIETLIQAGAEVNVSTKTGWTPLMSAPASAAKLLLDAGANPNTANQNGETALHHCRSTTKAKLLLEHGALLEARTLHGETPIMFAARKGRLPMVRWFCHEPDLANALDDRGNDILLIAAQAGKLNVVRFLLKCGRNPHLYNEDAQDLLICSCQTDNPGLASLALEQGCDVNYQDTRGFSALMYCIESGFEKTIPLLLEAGADPSLENNDGQSAMSLADVSCRKSFSHLLNGNL